MLKLDWPHVHVHLLPQQCSQSFLEVLLWKRFCENSHAWHLGVLRYVETASSRTQGGVARWWKPPPLSVIIQHNSIGSLPLKRARNLQKCKPFGNRVNNNTESSCQLKPIFCSHTPFENITNRFLQLLSSSQKTESTWVYHMHLGTGWPDQTKTRE